jgi:UDP-glucose:(heptosyl)LPS alpha-1,3-glucosyltransferase
LRSPAGVSYAGALAGEELRDLYAAADVFVLPTLYDPCANVCLEALAAGRPVITTRQNGAAELLREGINGSVVPHPAATAALAAAIQHWARHPRGTPVPVPEDVSMERNLRETLAVLELAAGSRFPGPGTGVAAGG